MISSVARTIDLLPAGDAAGSTPPLLALMVYFTAVDAV